tara:strand:+ start:524 stop:691 length:168 start_codon:yes stop_codon:yes gene_type:complete
MTEQVKIVIDISSLVVIGATLIELLPAIAAIFSIIWSILRILETETVKRWRGKIK